jgi:hypothetical protein
MRWHRIDKVTFSSGVGTGYDERGAIIPMKKSHENSHENFHEITCNLLECDL